MYICIVYNSIQPNPSASNNHGAGSMKRNRKLWWKSRIEAAGNAKPMHHGPLKVARGHGFSVGRVLTSCNSIMA